MLVVLTLLFYCGPAHLHATLDSESSPSRMSNMCCSSFLVSATRVRSSALQHCLGADVSCFCAGTRERDHFHLSLHGSVFDTLCAVLTCQPVWCRVLDDVHQRTCMCTTQPKMALLGCSILKTVYHVLYMLKNLPPLPYLTGTSILSPPG